MCGTAAEVSAWVMRGTADVGLSESKPGHTEFRYHGVFRDQLILCASPRWRAPLEKELNWRTLADFAPLIWERGTDLEPILLREFETRGLNAAKIAERRVRLNSASAVISLLQSGRFAGFVSFGAVRHLIAARQLVPLGDIGIPIPYWVFSPHNGELEPLSGLLAHAAAQMTANGAAN
jgi:DNA-binding transcriptional LysR family regulator